MRPSPRRPRLFVLAALLGLVAPVAAPRAQAAPKKLTVAIWSNYMPDAVLADFEKEHGCKVEIPWNYGSNDELLSRLQSKQTGFDLAFPSDLVLPVLISQGLLERIDPAKVPGLAHLDPAFRTRKADPKDEWSVPYTWGTVGIAWRTDKVKGPIDSWAVFGDAKATGENAYLLEEARDVIAAALLLRGRSVNSVEPAHLGEAKETLLGWRKAVKGYTGEVKDHLLSGEAWVIQAYNGDVAQAMAERKDLAFAVPTEGGILWVDTLVIPKGAPEKDLAHAFIEFVLRPDVAARISEGIRYAVPNKDAYTKVAKEIRENAVIYAPEDVRKRLQQETDLGDDLKKVTDLWSEVRAGD